MAFDELYRRQVGLLVRALPHIAEEACFALKGGTAINLFIRDLPRLSVDIDLTFLPIAPRDESLAAIDAALARISRRLRSGVAGARVTPSAGAPKLLVRAGDVQIKIEVTPVLRGCVFDPERRAVTPAVEAAFGFAETAVVSFADLYAGKIVAALDRQHPRDLFDVRELLTNEGVDDELRRAFLVYLVSHGRPMSEVLAPTRKDISAEFLRGFAGMTEQPVAKDELVAAREDMIRTVVGDMPAAHQGFLIGFERGEPDWSLIDLPEAAALPAVRWRQHNLEKLDENRRAVLVGALEKVFENQ